MQERPYWHDDKDDKKSDSKSDNPRLGSFALPSVERPAEPAKPVQEIKHIPTAPLEGVISWRQSEDVIKQHAAAETVKTSHEKDDDDDDDTEEETTTATTIAQPVTQKPAKPEPSEHQTETPAAEGDLLLAPEFTATAERPVSEVPEAVVAEAHTHYEKDTEDDDDAEDTDAVAPPHTARTAQPVTPAVPSPRIVRAPGPGETPWDRDMSSTAYSYDTALHAPTRNIELTPDDFGYDMPAAEAAVPTPPSQEDLDTPPPHVGVTEAADFHPPAPGVPPLEVGNIPPTPPPNHPAARFAAFDHAPQMYGQAPVESVQTAPVAPSHDATPVDNHRHGEPLAAAVGVGLVAEHIGRKRADRRQQEQFNQFTEQATQFQQENNTQFARMQEQQRQFGNEQQRQSDEMRRAQQQQQSQQERYSTPAAPYNLEYAPEPARETTPEPVAPVRPPNPLHQQYGRNAERVPQQPQPRQEAVRPIPGQPGSGERQPDIQAPGEYMAEVPVQPKQHIEQSAWHRIVTEHGHEVPDAIQYGQEFHRQRQHEIMADPLADADEPAAGTAASAEQQAAAQHTAYAQQQMPGAMPYQQPGHPGALPSGMTNPVLPPGAPTHVDAQHQLPAASSKQVASNMANPWFWIMLILIAAAFFTAALI